MADRLWLLDWSFFIYSYLSTFFSHNTIWICSSVPGLIPITRLGQRRSL
jgi:hypothetical protein